MHWDPAIHNQLCCASKHISSTFGAGEDKVLYIETECSNLCCASKHIPSTYGAGKERRLYIETNSSNFGNLGCMFTLGRALHAASRLKAAKADLLQQQKWDLLPPLG